MKKKLVKLFVSLVFLTTFVLNINSNVCNESRLQENLDALTLSSDISVKGRLYCCPLSGCYRKYGDLCVVCSAGLPGKCGFLYDWNEGCGIAGTCYP